jgi:16S rRNA (adenine1518-N6/adenine1519-N6)-dimethyltransferase
VEIRELLQRYGIRPSKGLGQNLLVADSAYERIIAASELTRDDFVLEIGPGLGTLTRRLADVAGHVTAVELDARMVTVLVDTLGDRTNVTVREGDILEIQPETLVTEPAAASCRRYKVVANLPYYITSRVLRHLLTATVRPSLLTVMVQKEVADRIIARPGELSLLAVSVQAYGEATLVCAIPPSAFFPIPRVSSAVLSIRTFPEPAVARAREERFFNVVRAGYQQRRKQLHNSLVANLGLGAARVDEALKAAAIAAQARPQMLDVAAWLRLTEALYPQDGP